MEDITITIAKDFSLTPGPRFINEGDFSGEFFRNSILEPKFLEAVKEKKKVIVNLDGTLGYGPSFLEESFGGLVRKLSKGLEDAKKLEAQKLVEGTIKIISTEEDYLIEEIKEYIKDANNKA